MKPWILQTLVVHEQAYYKCFSCHNKLRLSEWWCLDVFKRCKTIVQDGGEIYTCSLVWDWVEIDTRKGTDWIETGRGNTCQLEV